MSKQQNTAKGLQKVHGSCPRSKLSKIACFYCTLPVRKYRIFVLFCFFATLADTGATYGEAVAAVNAHFQPQVNVTF